jgi:CRISPR-associated protein Csb2
VILPGFDDGKRTKAERLFLQAVPQAGLSMEGVADFTLRKAPFWPASQHPNCYRRPDYLDSTKNRRFSAWHVHLSFRGPVAGPISIGAGRHCGLGVLASVREAKT